MYIRKQDLQHLAGESTFLWGARQTGKSTLLKSLYPDSLYFDLLLTDVFERLRRNPGLLRETLLANTRPDGSPATGPVIIDEIQRIPELLNEIHWLIANKGIQFILCGSSPRKILRSGANLLGGRALRNDLYPLIYKEITDFDLLKALNSGLLPRHYKSSRYEQLIAAYLGSYLQDEILAEAKIRNIQSFTRFLEIAALSNGEIVNYTSTAAESGVSAPTIKEYFQILEGTMVGRFLPSFRKKPKRRVIHAPKFYFFDNSIPNHLLKRGRMEWGSESIGNAFENYMYHEIFAHSHYTGLQYPIYYWRTASKLEVDFILGNHELAIEVKASQQVHSRHLKNLQQFAEEYQTRHLILVSNDPFPRQIGRIMALPWNLFLDQLWAGELIR